MSESFKPEELFWCINEIRKMCDEHVQNCGAKCPVGRNCNAMIKEIEADVRYADEVRKIAKCSHGEN